MQELIFGYTNPQQLKQISRLIDRNCLSLLGPGNHYFVTKNERRQIMELSMLQGANTNPHTLLSATNSLIKFVSLFQMKFIQIKDALLNFMSFTYTTNAVGVMGRLSWPNLQYYDFTFFLQGRCKIVTKSWSIYIFCVTLEEPLGLGRLIQVLSPMESLFFFLLRDCMSISLLFCCDSVYRRAEHSS